MLKYIFILHSGGPILKILITDGLSQEGLDLFANHSQISLDVRKKTEREELKTIINNYQGVIITLSCSFCIIPCVR